MKNIVIQACVADDMVDAVIGAIKNLPGIDTAVFHSHGMITIVAKGDVKIDTKSDVKEPEVADLPPPVVADPTPPVEVEPTAAPTTDMEFEIPLSLPDAEPTALPPQPAPEVEKLLYINSLSTKAAIEYKTDDTLKCSVLSVPDLIVTPKAIKFSCFGNEYSFPNNEAGNVTFSCRFDDQPAFTELFAFEKAEADAKPSVTFCPAPVPPKA